MNGSQAANSALLAGFAAQLPPSVDVVICPPFPYLSQLAQILAGSSVLLGAQNLSEYAEGAHTGEVSAAMLLDLGCTHVIVGHSERRAQQGESDALVRAKVERALASGLIPIVCVGEDLAQRQRGEALDVVLAQLDAVMNGLILPDPQRLVFAYEPIWAIGSGQAARSEQIAEMHRAIRQRAPQQRLLYGGSVKAATAAELFLLPDVDGALVGGASLSQSEFLSICRAAAAVQVN